MTLKWFHGRCITLCDFTDVPLTNTATYQSLNEVTYPDYMDHNTCINKFLVFQCEMKYDNAIYGNFHIQQAENKKRMTNLKKGID